MKLNSWDSDHQNWQNDIKTWEKEHALVRSTIHALEDKLRSYDAVLDYHRHQIADHSELMALPEETRDLLQLEEEGHSKEASIHQRLRELHQEVLRVSLDAVMRLGTLV